MMELEELIAARRHPAWRLLCSDNAPVVLAFLDVGFTRPGVRQLPVTQAAESLDNFLDGVRLHLDAPDSYPRAASAYLADWAKPDVGWMRRFFPPGSDEPLIEPTPAAEQALAFAAMLAPRDFVGTASRLRTAHDLLRQLVVGASPDRQERLDALLEQRAELDAQIDALQAGADAPLDDVAVRELFGDFVETGRALTRDMRTVEEKFRELDRHVRSLASTWEGPRGSLLDEVFGEQKSIGSSDEGQSWTAFWEYLLSPVATRDMDRMIQLLADIPAIGTQAGMARRLYRQDLFTAAQATQRTVASLSAQLRRFLDDQHWAETRRVDELIRQVLALGQEHLEAGTKRRLLTSEVPDTRAHVSLPVERPLYTPRSSVDLDDSPVSAGPDTDVDLTDAFAATRVDPVRLSRAIDEQLAADHGTTTLARVVASHPLEDGLEELVTYLTVTGDRTQTIDGERDTITWVGRDDTPRSAVMPRVTIGGTPPTDPDEEERA